LLSFGLSLLVRGILLLSRLGLAGLRLDAREQILHGVLHLRHQAGILAGVAGILLGVLRILGLVGLAIALLARWVVRVAARLAVARTLLVVARHLIFRLLVLLLVAAFGRRGHI